MSSNNGATMQRCVFSYKPLPMRGGKVLPKSSLAPRIQISESHDQGEGGVQDAPGATRNVRRSKYSYVANHEKFKGQNDNGHKLF